MIRTILTHALAFICGCIAELFAVVAYGDHIVRAIAWTRELL